MPQICPAKQQHASFSQQQAAQQPAQPSSCVSTTSQNELSSPSELMSILDVCYLLLTKIQFYHKKVDDKPDSLMKNHYLRCYDDMRQYIVVRLASHLPLLQWNN